MRKIKLEREEYLDKLRGCWLGKNIGGTFGAALEGRKYVHALTSPDDVREENLKFLNEKYNGNPPESMPNDDLDFQLVWLKMLEDRGINPTFRDFSDYWMKHLYKHWYSEYSFCTYNLKRGLKPPISGAFQNYFVDEMGSPIRSEIWGCIAPGDPQLAASLAWMDSSMDHTGGEGRWGEMFWAAVESAAFVINDPKTLIEIGLSMIPISSHIARCIKEAVRCFEEKILWGEARERIATLFGHHNPANAVPNHGFIIIGWLYGKDYGDKICKAVNCGYDTDCTGATLGALLGILNGASGIPEIWKKSVSNVITPVVHTVTDGLPLTIDDLTVRTEKVAYKMISERAKTVEFSDKKYIPEDVLSILFANEDIRDLLTFDIHCSVEEIEDLQVVFHYGGEPVIHPHIEKVLEVSFRKNWSLIDINSATIEIKGPAGWKISTPVIDRGRYKFSILAENIEKKNLLEITVKRNNKTDKINFTLLGEDAVKVIPASTTVPKEYQEI